jgi:hypothetical protein
MNVKPTSDDKNWMDSSIEGASEQTEQAIVNQCKLLNEVRAKQQGVLDNYFTAIRLKSQINANDKTSSKGGKSTQSKNKGSTMTNNQ